MSEFATFIGLGVVAAVSVLVALGSLAGVGFLVYVVWVELTNPSGWQKQQAEMEARNSALRSEQARDPRPGVVPTKQAENASASSTIHRQRQ